MGFLTTMDIKQPTGPGQSSTRTYNAITVNPSANANTSNRHWQSGQLLELVVLKLGANQALLNIDGIEYVTQDKARLQLGQHLIGEVIKQYPPMLKIIAKTHPAAIINQALRTTMPKQLPSSELWRSLEILARLPDPDADKPVHNNLLQIASNLLKQLPNPEMLRKPEQFKYFLQRSGLFTQHALAQSIKMRNPFPQQDLQLQLMRLATQLRHMPPSPSNPAAKGLMSSGMLSPATTLPATQAYNPVLSNQIKAAYAQQPPAQSGSQKPAHPATQPAPTGSTHGTTPGISSNMSSERMIEILLQQTEGSLARLQTLQLQSAQLHSTQAHSTQLQNEALGNLWTTELPVRHKDHTDIFELFYEHDGQQQQNRTTTPVWRITLQFDLEGLGSMQANVSLQNEKISVAFWAQQSVTAELFSRHLQDLKQRLTSAGLDTQKLDCLCGERPPAPQPKTPAQLLLDERA